MKMSGSKIIVERLLQQGVDTVFGFPGGAIMPLYDALYDAPLRHVLTVHEQGAAHAADGYARSSGRVGVCIATSGPGATNLVTGLATAFMDSSPVVAITGQVSTALLGRDAFQEIDITGITMPVTKHSFLVRDVRELADTIDEAFTIAASGRPGPVLVDVPRDVLLAQTDYNAKAASPTAARLTAGLPCEQALKAAAAALLSAQRPVMVAGGGVIAGHAHQEILALSKTYRMPIVSTLMGLGSVPAGYPDFLGLVGMHGHKAANYAAYEADVVLAVGTRFSDRATGDPARYASGKTVIHLDVDPAEIDKNVAATVTVVGELRQSLTRLTALLSEDLPPDRPVWREQIARWQKLAVEYEQTKLTAPWMMHAMSTATCGKPVIWVTDVGQHQMWAAQHLALTTPRSWITSGGLGTMGFGMPAALGAQAACPDKRVVLIAGDGGFKMTGMELYTAMQEKLPVICVIINNRALGMVRQWQQLFFQERYSSTLLPDFDFAAFANSCGAASVSVSTPGEFETAFAAALHSLLPSVIIANIDQEQLVEPMVAPGASLNQFVDI